MAFSAQSAAADAVGLAERPAADLTDQRVIPLRHPGRWIATIAVLVLAAQFLHGLATNPFYQWGRFGYWFARPVIMRGLWVTLEVTALSAVLGLLGGVVLALARLSRNPVLRTISWVYIWLFRSVPLIVVLLILFNFSALYKTLSSTRWTSRSPRGTSRSSSGRRVRASRRCCGPSTIWRSWTPARCR